MRKAKYIDLYPIAFPEATKEIGGRQLTAMEKASGLFTGDRVEGIHVHETSHGYISIWKCHSLWYRLRFLFTGKMNVSVNSKPHPPLSLSIGDTFNRP